MPKLPSAADGEALIDACHARSIALLRRNLTPAGILAASPGARAARRGYSAIFGRDAAICAIGMALSGDPVLEQAAAAGLETLGEHQAPNGQIPKFVDPDAREDFLGGSWGFPGALVTCDGGSQRFPRSGGGSQMVSSHSRRRISADFWYLGCIDATLWWLLALDFLERARPARRAARGPRGAASRPDRDRRIRRALEWLLAQEHQRFFLLQQNEASDWADIMPRSGFVLYSNALWYAVKRRYGLPHAEATRENFNGLFHPFSAELAPYRRARLLNEYVLRRARNRDLYLSFVNFSFFGEEGDVLGNLLAVLYGLADRDASRRTLAALERARVSRLYPVRVVTRPIRRRSALWRPYMARHRQNEAWQYHNGGIWPMVGGFWVAALASGGRLAQARLELARLARACALESWRFTEWLHGTTGAPRGMSGQSWNAAAFLIAERAVAERRNVLAVPSARRSAAARSR